MMLIYMRFILDRDVCLFALRRHLYITFAFSCVFLVFLIYHGRGLFMPSASVLLLPAIGSVEIII